MGNLFSRHTQPVLTTDDEQFFDCLNDDEPTVQQNDKIVSHYYAVWIPVDIDIAGRNERDYTMNNVDESIDI
jgi:hypothetical protein